MCHQNKEEDTAAAMEEEEECVGVTVTEETEKERGKPDQLTAEGDGDSGAEMADESTAAAAVMSVSEGKVEAESVIVSEEVGYRLGEDEDTWPKRFEKEDALEAAAEVGSLRLHS